MNPLGGDSKGKGDIQATRVSIDLLVGKSLGEYRVIERINQGGMGILYRGEHSATHKAVAIKVLLPEFAKDPEFVRRLLGEARAVTSIRHANIIEFFSVGQLPDGRHYIVMELLTGQALSEVVRESGPLAAAQVQLVLEQTMSALVAAHSAGIIHRDLKPENIFVDPRSGGWRITLLDFGLAKQQGAQAQLTAPNLMLGTPGFMAPEQIRGQESTSAIDIYAMGVVAWSLLTGREPFLGGSMVEVMQKHLDSPVPSMRALIPSVPVALEALVIKMMAKEPKGRPSAAEVAKSLGRMKHEPTGGLDSSLMATRLNPAQPRTRPEVPTLVRALSIGRAPLILAALGVAVGGGALAIFLSVSAAQPVVPVDPLSEAQAVVVVDPPRPKGPSRAEVERRLSRSRAKVPSLSHARTRRSVLLQLAKLDSRLKKNEPPAAVARDLERLLRNYDLK